MTNNSALHHDNRTTFKWKPLLNESKINAMVHVPGIKQTEIVRSYAFKSETENSAMNKEKVKSMVRDIEIQFGLTTKNVRKEIDNQLANVFNWNWMFPNDSVIIKVENGWVTLEGEVHWNYQRKAAQKTVRSIAGVKGVTNSITLKSATNEEVKKKDIILALIGNREIDIENIRIKVFANKVMLRGTVISKHQKAEAERTVWSTPGVWVVENELVIESIKKIIR